MTADPITQRNDSISDNMVTLRLGGEMLAIPSNVLREVLEPGPVTRVPNAPPFAAGLINVRGAVVPLTDLRIPLKMTLVPPDNDTRILVLDLQLGGGNSVVGILAEKVHEVTSINRADLTDVPDIGTRWPPGYVRAIGRRDDSFFIIPDLDAIFAAYVADGVGATPQSEKGNEI